MSKTTKILIRHNGEPIVGAQVLVGELLGNWRETDEDGRIAFLTEDDFAAIVAIAIKDGGLPQEAHIARVIESGEEEIIDIVNPIA